MKRTVFGAIICLAVMMLMPSCSQNEGEVESKAQNDKLKIEKMEQLFEKYQIRLAPSLSKAKRDSMFLAADYDETEMLLKALKKGAITVNDDRTR